MELKERELSVCNTLLLIYTPRVQIYIFSEEVVEGHDLNQRVKKG
jgi:hypothetical protein